MPFNTVFSWFIKKRVHQIDLFKKFPLEVQEELFQKMLGQGLNTSFGRDHSFFSIRTVKDYQKQVPIRNYEGLKGYIDRSLIGEEDVLWPGRVKWFAKSSGTTTSKSKLIPMTRESLEECHYKGGKDLLAMYCFNNHDSQIYAGKTLMMGGSSDLSSLNADTVTGDLSAIIIQNLPMWVNIKRTPNKGIALMDNWEEKIEKMAHTTIKEDVSVVTGVPSWTLVLFKRILEITGAKSIKEVWPNLELFMHGGVSFKPYRPQFDTMVNHSGLNYYETYNASEGFFGLQDRNNSEEMLLMLDYGIFYEFLPMSELTSEDRQTLMLSEVEMDVAYALVITTNAGLWRYLIGDTIKFTSLSPYRIKVVGRTKLFINAFGEEVIIDNAEEAVRRACVATNSIVNDYTVAPVFMTEQGTGAHEWVMEFERAPKNLSMFVELLDSGLKELNSDYEAKRSADLSLGKPIVNVVPCETFYQWLKSKGKLGGQHKVPRLCNDGKLMDELTEFISEQNLILEKV